VLSANAGFHSRPGYTICPATPASIFGGSKRRRSADSGRADSSLAKAFVVAAKMAWVESSAFG